MTDESRRVYANASDRTRHVTYECRHCMEVTHVYVPIGAKAYKYGVCAECAASMYAAERGIKVMTG